MANLTFPATLTIESSALSIERGVTVTTSSYSLRTTVAAHGGARWVGSATLLPAGSGAVSAFAGAEVDIQRIADPRNTLELPTKRGNVAVASAFTAPAITGDLLTVTCATAQPTGVEGSFVRLGDRTYQVASYDASTRVMGLIPDVLPPSTVTSFTPTATVRVRVAGSPPTAERRPSGGAGTGWLLEWVEAV